MLSERFHSELKQVLSERDFFFKLRPEDFKLNAVGSEWIIKASGSNSRDIFQMPEELLKKLFTNSEILHLKHHQKKLAVHKNLLLLFNSDLAANIEDVDSMQLLQGYAELTGATVASSDPEETKVSNQKAAMFASQTKSTFSFQVTLAEESGSHCETIYFESKIQQERWRKLLSDAPVIFTDFETRYSISQSYAKEGRKQIVQVQCNQTKEKLIARVVTASQAQDSRDLAKLKQSFLEESKILLQLRSANITANFRELCFTGKSFLILEEPLEAVRFAEWFTGTWCYEVGAITDQRPVLNLFTDLAMMVLTLNSQSVSHGMISKETIIVKANCITATPNWVTPQIKRKGVKTFLQSMAPVKFGQLQRPQEGAAQVAFRGENEPGMGSQADSKAGFKEKLLSTKTDSYQKEDQTGKSHDPTRKFYLVQFNQATLQGAAVSDHFIRKPKHSQSREGSHKSGLEDDVFALGALFFEILFGINLARGLSQEHGIETDFVAALLKKPRVVIEYREPLYDIDEKIIDMIGSMLEPDKLNRPTIGHCYNLIQSTTRERGKMRKATRHFTKLRTVLYSQFSIDESECQNPHHAKNQNDPLIVSISELNSPLYSALKQEKATGSQEIEFTGQHHFVKEEIVMETAPADPEPELQKAAFDTGQKTFSHSSRVITLPAAAKEIKPLARLNSNSPPKLQKTPNLPQKMPTTVKKTAVGKGLVLRTGVPAAERLQAELNDFLGSEGLPTFVQPAHVEQKKFELARKVALVPQVCVIARETFKVENKPRKVLLPKAGGSSACSSIFELPAGGQAQKRDLTPNRGLPSETPLSQVSRTNFSLRMKVRGLSVSRASDSQHFPSPLSLAKPRVSRV